MSGGSRKSGEAPDSTRLSPAVSSSDKTPPKSGSRPPSTIITPPTATAPVATAGPVQKPKKVTDDKSTKLLKKPTNVNKKLSPRKVKEDLRKQAVQNPNSKLADLRSQRELEAANKKLEGLTADVTKLKKELSSVTKENTAVKNERSIKDLEIEKLGQFWQISKNELKDAIKQRYEVEERYERMKTAHLEEVSLLHKKVKFLTINATIHSDAITQTEPEPKIMEEMFLASKSTQTSDILTARDAKMKLRLDDAQLAELISQLESEKLAAQADYKFAVVQVETRMKIEKAAEIRRVREEKLREIESLSRTHNQQLLAMDEEYERALTSANESGSHLKLEMVKVTDELEQAKRQIETLTSESKTSHDALIQLREEKVVREKLLKTQKATEHAIKRDEATFSEMKRRLSLLEELNEIILGEYRVLEKARNDLIYAITHKMPEPSPDLLAPYEKSTNLAQQLDEARGRHRKWQK